ncbi:MAG: hypothetical protein ACRDGN_14850 [bacterium]
MASGLTTNDGVSSKPRWAKLGITPDSRIAIIGVTERGFRSEIRAAGGRIVPGRTGADLSHVIVQADRRPALHAVRSAARMIAPNGAVWVVTPRGIAAVTEADALAAGRSAGLTDVNVIRFSDTHTAHKFVIPRALRKTR